MFMVSYSRSLTLQSWLNKLGILIVGDPGLGKSQLLQAAAAVSPRGIYVCGNATTNAGLTVAVVKDPMTSDYAFEAGIILSLFMV